MRKALLSGCLLAVAAALIVLLGQLFGDDLQHLALLGAALGGVVGLVPHQPAWGKLAGFGIGFVLAWIGFALRAAVLPDAASGRAVAAFLVVLLCVLACAVSDGRIPLWSALVGTAAIVGAYEATYTISPSQFLSESPTAATTILFAAALGYLATNVIAESLPRTEEQRRAHAAAPALAQHTDTLDSVLAGETK